MPQGCTTEVVTAEDNGGTARCTPKAPGDDGLSALPGVVPSVALAAAVAVCVGLFAGLGGALTQTVTDPAYLGRVTSVSTLFTHAIAPLGYPVTGAAVAVWGTGPVFVTSAVVCASGAVAGLAFTRLRRAELPR